MHFNISLLYIQSSYMFQPLLAIFRESFIYYKNIKLLRYNVVSICPGLITIKIIKY